MYLLSEPRIVETLPRFVCRPWAFIRCGLYKLKVLGFEASGNGRVSLMCSLHGAGPVRGDCLSSMCGQSGVLLCWFVKHLNRYHL